MSGISLSSEIKQQTNLCPGKNNDAETSGNADSSSLNAFPTSVSYTASQSYGRLFGLSTWKEAIYKSHNVQFPSPTGFPEYKEFDNCIMHLAEFEREEFIKDRPKRSHAQLSDPIESQRNQPNVSNPGADSANFPNSPYTLPQGWIYVELSPYTYSGSSQGSPGQYGTEFLLRYGLTDNIEIRLFGNGISWTEGSDATVGFSPIGFDTKILLLSEQQAYYLPAVGFEVSLQTELLGSSAFNSGTQPSFTLNFDQSLPFDIDFGYSLSATRLKDSNDDNIWTLDFQWALQRNLINNDFAVFVDGFYQPNINQNAVGGGFVWTVTRRFGLYGQVSAGTTKFTPALISNVGFVIAF